MKSLAILAVAAVVLVTGVMHAGASAPPIRHSVAASLHLLVPAGRAAHGQLVFRRVSLPLQTAATPTPSPTGTVAPTPTATAIPGLPDAQTVLGNAVQILAAINSIHFSEVATQDGAVHFHIQATGDATCTPAVKAVEKASRSIPGTKQSTTHTFNVIEYKNSVFWKYKKTKNRWQRVKPNKATNFGLGFLPENPLVCPSVTSGGGTGGSSPTFQAKDLTIVGPGTVKGVSVWHLHETLVQVDAQGNTSDLPVDFYIGQKNNLLYRDVLSFSDSSQGVSGAITTTRSKFGEHIKIAKPRVGSAKP